MLCIVMEYADSGDLLDKIKEHKKKSEYIEEKKIIDWFTQILLAIKHCHENKIIHRDIKCENIFLHKNGMAKLGDFGIARALSNTMSQVYT